MSKKGNLEYIVDELTFTYVDRFRMAVEWLGMLAAGREDVSRSPANFAWAVRAIEEYAELERLRCDPELLDILTEGVQ